MSSFIYFLSPLLQQLRKCFEQGGEETAKKFVDDLPVEKKLQLLRDIEEMVADQTTQRVIARIRATTDKSILSRHMKN